MTYVGFLSLTIALLPLTLSAATTGTTRPTTTADPSDSSDLTSLRAKALGGDSIAQYNLGLAHLQGRQTPINLNEAYAWLTLAAEGGITGRALDTVLDAFTPEQLAVARRQLQTLRAENPTLRPPVIASAPKPPATTIPIIDEPAPVVRPAPSSTPIIAIPPTDAPVAADTRRLQNKVAALEQEKNQLAAELLRARKEVEQLESRPRSPAGASVELSSAQKELEAAQVALARQAAELATLRTEAATAGVQNRKLESDLSAARDALKSNNSIASEADEAAAALERERAAHAATQGALAQLSSQIGELTAARADLEREALERTSAAGRALAAAAGEAKTLSSRSAELEQKTEKLGSALEIAQRDVATLRKSLAESEERRASTRNELAHARTALEAANRRAHLAESRVSAGEQAEAQLDALRSQVSALERDLQNVRTGSNRILSEKASVEVEVNDANRKLAEASKSLSALRRQVAETSQLESASSNQKISALQSELDETKSRLHGRLATAEKTVAARDAELAQLRSAAAAAASRPAISAGDLEAAKTAAGAAQLQLAQANRELAALREQVASAHELNDRIRQLEAEKATLAARLVSQPDNGAGPVRSSETDLANKLATALRSYTLVARERDELKARVAEFSARSSTPSEAPTRAEAQASSASESNSASVAASAEMETLRNRLANAEREAEDARAELARANQLLAGLRPPSSQPTRPKTPVGEPARTHTIAPGETLSSIAVRYYNDAGRWSDILSANRDVLVDERSFAVGRTLRIP